MGPNDKNWAEPNTNLAFRKSNHTSCSGELPPRTGAVEDPNKAINCHKKDHTSKKPIPKNLMAEDDELRENYSDDVRDDHQDSLEDDHQEMLEDDHQDMLADGDAKKEGDLDETDHVVTMARKNNTIGKTNPKNLETYDSHKDKGKVKVGKTSKKATQAQQRKKSKSSSQPQMKKKRNHAYRQGHQTDSKGRVAQKDKSYPKAKNPTAWKDINYCDDVEEVCLPSDNKSGSLSMNDLWRKLNAKKEKVRLRKPNFTGTA
uniref:Uncharacterized protein n=1 Tax=Cannabis sativa TaxID=3483 RepID=A0A803NR41_CANSA